MLYDKCLKLCLPVLYVKIISVSVSVYKSCTRVDTRDVSAVSELPASASPPVTQPLASHSVP